MGGFGWRAAVKIMGAGLGIAAIGAVAWLAVQTTELRADLDAAQHRIEVATEEIDTLSEEISDPDTATTEAEARIEALERQLFGIGPGSRSRYGRTDLFGSVLDEIQDIRGEIRALRVTSSSSQSGPSTELQAFRNDLADVERCVLGLLRAIDTGDSFGASIDCRYL